MTSARLVTVLFTLLSPKVTLSSYSVPQFVFPTIVPSAGTLPSHHPILQTSHRSSERVGGLPEFAQWDWNPSLGSPFPVQLLLPHLLQGDLIVLLF